MSDQPRITVYGMGYVGTVSAACLASLGFSVTGVESNSRKVAFINSGSSPIIEPGMDSLLRKGVSEGRLAAVTEASRQNLGEVVLVCVGTPNGVDGSPNLGALFAVMRPIAEIAPDNRRIVAIRSTVPPGTAAECQVILGDAAVVCSNPEFMREGHAINDFRKPPYVLIGTDDEDAVAPLAQVYEPLDTDVVYSGVREAEMIKYVSNSWHAVKVAFANEIGSLAREWGAQTHAVMDLFVRDTHLNLSAAYLRPGAPFGGSCLPKDLTALATAAEFLRLNTPLIGHAMEANEAHIRRCLSLVREQEGNRIAWLGLSFKDNTDDLRGSPALKMVQALLEDGKDVQVFDPNIGPAELIGANRLLFEETLEQFGAERIRTSLDDCLDGADTVVLFTATQQVSNAVFSSDDDFVIIDLVGDRPRRKRDRYYGVCWYEGD